MPTWATPAPEARSPSNWARLGRAFRFTLAFVVELPRQHFARETNLLHARSQERSDGMAQVVTLLLSDVVDSTQLNDQVGDAVMTQLWGAHDCAARELIAIWRGREVARSDGFLIIFDSASDAAAFALAYHQANRAIDTRLKARVGLHVGSVILRENSELDRARGAPQIEIDGVALPVVARVMAAASGAQTLLTAPAVQALGSTTGRAIRSHGHWRLKGLSEPLELFELRGQEGVFEPPADSAKAYKVIRNHDEWMPARKIPNNLPAERDTFIGRSDALHALTRLFDGNARLVTLLGIGGIGKTRLALRHARAWLGDYPGGTWFCDLSTARGIDGIVSSVAHALDVPLGKSDPVQQIASAIAARGACLVILDTFEQVARHAEATVGVWLEHAAEARFVVTSREVLGISGEQAQVLPPMDEDEAGRLFMGRVAAANRSKLGAADRAAVTPLVRLLDGLPLAIELAAARSRVMSPRMLLERMNERFTLLSTRGGRLDRQVTLRATLDWSWDLLLAQEKSALGQLSVFEGGFTLEAIEAILQVGRESAPAAPLDLLQSLVDKSFVRQVADDRFGLLQSVQEYAAQHLRTEGRFEGSGAAAALGAEIRHGTFFGGIDEAEASAPGFLELDNLTAACRRAVARSDSMTATLAVRRAWAVLELRGPIKVGLDLASSVLSIPRLPPAMLAEVLLIKGRALRTLGRIEESRACFESALAHAKEVADRRLEARALSNLGRPTSDLAVMEEARRQLETGLTLARETGERTLECELLNGLGALNDYAGRNNEALANYQKALALARELCNQRWQAGILGNLANINYKQARIQEARAAYEQGIELARLLGIRQWEGNMLCNFSLLRHAEGDSVGAIALLERSLQASREMGLARLEVTALCNLGIVEEATGALAEAEAHLLAAMILARNMGDQRVQGQILGYLGLTQTKSGRTAEGRLTLEGGRRLLEATASHVDLAILRCCSAVAHAVAGSSHAAAVELRGALDSERQLGEATDMDLTLAVKRAKRAVSLDS